MQISVTHDLDRLHKRMLHIHKKQIPFAASKALNKTANEVKEAEVLQLDKDLDRPTPFTKRGFYTKRSSKRNLIASVGIKDIQARYLKYAIEGGKRTPKNKAIVEPMNIRLNKYGNLTRNKIKTLLAKPNTFSANLNGRAGIWQRNKSGKLKLLISFREERHYTPRFEFYETAERVAKQRFNRNLSASIRHAIKTAK